MKFIAIFTSDMINAVFYWTERGWKENGKSHAIHLTKEEADILDSLVSRKNCLSFIKVKQ